MLLVVKPILAVRKYGVVSLYLSRMYIIIRYLSISHDVLDMRTQIKTMSCTMYTKTLLCCDMVHACGKLKEKNFVDDDDTGC